MVALSKDGYAKPPDDIPLIEDQQQNSTNVIATVVNSKVAILWGLNRPFSRTQWVLFGDETQGCCHFIGT